MMRLLHAAVLAASLAAYVAVLPPAASAQSPAHPTLPQRIELHPFASLTLSDSQFLTGDRSGKPVTLAGEFRIAQGSGRLPVAVLMHGSGGVGANIEPWAEELNAMGVSVFIIDGFTGRGITATSTNQAQLGRLNFILDIYRVLEILAKHPRVDPQRIALIGFSRGGQAALYASIARFHKLWNASGIDFAAYIPFYPDCATSYMDETAVVPKPIRVFHGTADDYNPMATCNAFIARLKTAGRDATITGFAGADHFFDTPFPVGTLVAVKAQTVRGCTIRETEPGVLTNTATNQPFSYEDGCVARDPHFGGDVEAGAAARQAVGAFIKDLFKLK